MATPKTANYQPGQLTTLTVTLSIDEVKLILSLTGTNTVLAQLQQSIRDYLAANSITVPP